MRYHYQKPDIYLSMYGELYICNHPVYDRCTLFTIGNKGLAVIQQRFSADTKSTYWTESIHADRLFIFTSKIQGIFRQPIRRVYGRIVSNGHYKTNNVGVKNETNTASAMGNVFR
jgi:hypothetical protein